jgi:hypothetical protein
VCQSTGAGPTATRTATAATTAQTAGSATKSSQGGAHGAKGMETGFMAALVVGAIGAVL